MREGSRSQEDRSTRADSAASSAPTLGPGEILNLTGDPPPEGHLGARIPDPIEVFLTRIEVSTNLRQLDKNLLLGIQYYMSDPEELTMPQFLLELSERFARKCEELSVDTDRRLPETLLNPLLASLAGWCEKACTKAESERMHTVLAKLVSAVMRERDLELYSGPEPIRENGWPETIGRLSSYVRNTPPNDGVHTPTQRLAFDALCNCVEGQPDRANRLHAFRLVAHTVGTEKSTDLYKELTKRLEDSLDVWCNIALRETPEFSDGRVVRPPRAFASLKSMVDRHKTHAHREEDIGDNYRFVYYQFIKTFGELYKPNREYLCNLIEEAGGKPREGFLDRFRRRRNNRKRKREEQDSDPQGSKTRSNPVTLLAATVLLCRATEGGWAALNEHSTAVHGLLSIAKDGNGKHCSQALVHLWNLAKVFGPETSRDNEYRYESKEVHDLFAERIFSREQQRFEPALEAIKEILLSREDQELALLLKRCANEHCDESSRIAASRALSSVFRVTDSEWIGLLLSDIANEESRSSLLDRYSYRSREENPTSRIAQVAAIQYQLNVSEELFKGLSVAFSKGLLKEDWDPNASAYLSIRKADSEGLREHFGPQALEKISFDALCQLPELITLHVHCEKVGDLDALAELWRSVQDELEKCTSFLFHGLKIEMYSAGEEPDRNLSQIEEAVRNVGDPESDRKMRLGILPIRVAFAPSFNHLVNFELPQFLGKRDLGYSRNVSQPRVDRDIRHEIPEVSAKDIATPVDELARNLATLGNNIVSIDKDTSQNEARANLHDQVVPVSPAPLHTPLSKEQFLLLQALPMEERFKVLEIAFRYREEHIIESTPFSGSPILRAQYTSLTSFISNIAQNADSLIDVLTRMEPLEVARSEVVKSIRLLLKAVGDLRQRGSSPCKGVVAELSRNYPLSSLVGDVVVPSIFAEQAYARPAATLVSGNVFKDLCRTIGLSSACSSRDPLVTKGLIRRAGENIKLPNGKKDAMIPRGEFLKSIAGSFDTIITSEKLSRAKQIFDEHKDLSPNLLVIGVTTGHNPIIVEGANIDFERVAEEVVRAVTTNSGQDCWSPCSVLINCGPYDNGTFVEALQKRLQAVRVGPYDQSTIPPNNVGPLTTAEPENWQEIREFLAEHEQHIRTLDGKAPVVIRESEQTVNPTIFSRKLSEGAFLDKKYAPFVNVQAFHTWKDLKEHFFGDPRYIESAMYVSIYSEWGGRNLADSIANLRYEYDETQKRWVLGDGPDSKPLHTKDSILINQHVHSPGLDIGIKPSGGYGPGSTYLIHKGESIARPFTISSAIRDGRKWVEEEIQNDD